MGIRQGSSLYNDVLSPKGGNEIKNVVNCKGLTEDIAMDIRQGSSPYY